MHTSTVLPKFEMSMDGRDALLSENMMFSVAEQQGIGRCVNSCKGGANFKSRTASHLYVLYNYSFG